jgi:hypothetical protein
MHELTGVCDEISEILFVLESPSASFLHLAEQRIDSVSPSCPLGRPNWGAAHSRAAGIGIDAASPWRAGRATQPAAGAPAGSPGQRKIGPQMRTKVHSSHGVPLTGSRLARGPLAGPRDGPSWAGRCQPVSRQGYEAPPPRKSGTVQLQPADGHRERTRRGMPAQSSSVATRSAELNRIVE